MGGSSPTSFSTSQSKCCLSRRNSRIGYCQGLNYIASYFLKYLDNEEVHSDNQDVFWIICYIIEESMPKEYYTNMLSVLADMQILQLIFAIKYPDLAKHFKKNCVGLEMVALPCFITLFTNCGSELVEIIVDFFFLDGPITLIKAMVVLFGYIRKDIIKINDIGTIFSSLGVLIRKINEKLKSNLVPVEQFFQDLGKFYLSRFSIDILREHFTEKERKKIINQKKTSQNNISDCERDWPICITNIVKNSYYFKSPSFYIYRDNSILSNIKTGHFKNNRKKNNLVLDKDVKDRTSVRFQQTQDAEDFVISMHSGYSQAQVEKKPREEDNLLIERQPHKCKIEDDQEYRYERQEALDGLRRKLDMIKQEMINEQQVYSPRKLTAQGIDQNNGVLLKKKHIESSRQIKGISEVEDDDKINNTNFTYRIPI